MRQITHPLLLSVFLTLCIGCNLDPPRLFEERMENSAKDLSCIYGRVYIPDHPLELEEVIEIAAWNNLDLLVKEFQYEVQREVAESTKWTLVPSLQLNYTLDARNNLLASISRSLTNTPPAPPSTSSTKTTQLTTGRLLWNVLNFSVSYFTARQEADKKIQKELEYRRTFQNLVLAVAEHYWLVVALNRGIEKAEKWIEQAIHQQEVVERLIAKQVLSQIPGLIREGSILEMSLRLNLYRKDRDIAFVELAQLMGISPDTPFTLKEIELEELPASLPDVEELEEMAMQYRPELYSTDLDVKIQRNEVKKAIADMFPSLEFYVGTNYDNNSFLIFNNWVNAGLRATWDLFALPSKAYHRKSAVFGFQAAYAGRLAQSVVVLTQVHLALINFEEQKKQYLMAKKYHSVESRLFKGMKLGLNKGLFNLVDVMDVEAKMVASEVEALKLYAASLAAIEKINNAMGLPLWLSYKDGAPPDE